MRREFAGVVGVCELDQNRRRAALVDFRVAAQQVGAVDVLQLQQRQRSIARIQRFHGCRSSWRRQTERTTGNTTKPEGQPRNEKTQYIARRTDVRAALRIRAVRSSATNRQLLKKPSESRIPNSSNENDQKLENRFVRIRRHQRNASEQEKPRSQPEYVVEAIV